MMRTPRVIEVTGRRAIVGSDSFYARFHQLGEGDMYRPFWPFDKEGNMTPEAQRLVRWVLKKRLGIVR